MHKSAPTYIWRKLATAAWIETNEWKLHEMTGGEFAIIERPTRKRLLVEVPCHRARQADRLLGAFGGRREKLSRDWLNEMLSAKSSEPIRVGKRLVVSSDEKH